MRNPVISFFDKVNPLCGDWKWNLQPVDEKTLRDWFSEKREPSGDAAKAVALWIWKEIQKADKASLKKEVFKALHEMDPEAPDEKDTEFGFGAYFEDLAERCRSRVTIEVLVKRGNEQHFRLVTDSGVAPVPAGSKVRVSVTATHPIFLHLVWIPSQGEATPLYPWKAGYWDQVQPHYPVPGLARLALPSDIPYWEIDTPAGCETCVVMKLVFRVPNSVLTGLASSLKGLHTPGNLAHLSKVVRFDSANAGTSRERLNVNPTIPERDRLAWLHHELTHRLQANFDRVVGVSFPNAGGKAGKA